MIKVIINKQHTIKESQKVQLDALAAKVDCDWERLDVPATGWTALEQYDVAQNLTRSSARVVVFASPLPYMIKLMSMASASNQSDVTVLVFHNDRREKKELPNGKVIYTVAETGWELL